MKSKTKISIMSGLAAVPFILVGIVAGFISEAILVGFYNGRAKFKGCFTCANVNCTGAVLDGTGARGLHEELCRQSGMTADQIISSWNRKSPEDQW